MIETPLNEAPITDIIVTPLKETYYAKYTYSDYHLWTNMIETAERISCKQS